MQKISERVSKIDFDLLNHTKNTIAWNGGPKLYQSIIESHLGSDYEIRRLHYLANVRTYSTSLNFVNERTLLSHVKAPGLSYSGTSLQWQLAVPDS